MSEDKKNIIKKKLNTILQVALYIFDLLIDIAVSNLIIIKSNINLFLGMVVLVFGLFGFESNKYCDGNTADYLSCTRPTTYYYYDGLDIALIILGVSLVVIWFLRRHEARNTKP